MSDNQRKAVFANMNKFSNNNRFALYIKKDNDEYRIRSDEYPEVDVGIGGFGIKEKKAFDEYIKHIPEQDLIGIQNIWLCRPDIFEKLFDSKDSFYFRGDDTVLPGVAPIVGINIGGGKKRVMHDVLHEIGHHVDDSMSFDYINIDLNKYDCDDIFDALEKGQITKDQLKEFVAGEVTAETYVSQVGGPEYILDGGIGYEDKTMDFKRALAEERQITFDEAKKYVGEDDEIHE